MLLFTHVITLLLNCLYLRAASQKKLANLHLVQFIFFVFGDIRACLVLVSASLQRSLISLHFSLLLQGEPSHQHQRMTCMSARKIPSTIQGLLLSVGTLWCLMTQPHHRVRRGKRANSSSGRCMGRCFADCICPASNWASQAAAHTQSVSLHPVYALVFLPGRQISPDPS